MAQYKLHTFRPGETIDAVIKLLGRHNLTKNEMVPLRQAFNELNENVVPRPGTTCKIPTPSMPEVINDGGDVEDTENSENAVDDSAQESNERQE